MKAENYICVWDLETNSLCTQTAHVVEWACLLLDPVTLKIVPGSEFESLSRPADLSLLDDTDDKRKALSISGLTRDDLKDAPVEEAVCRAFAAHIKKVCGRKRAVPAGYNITRFDLPLYDRLCRDYGLAGKAGVNPSFLGGTVFDAKDCIQKWFYRADDFWDPSFDGVREYFGMSKGTGGKDKPHRAMHDVRGEAWVCVKFLRLYQKLKQQIKFAGSAVADGGVLRD